MKKVCMLTSGHLYNDNRIFYKEARTLQENGYNVSVIAPVNKDGYFLNNSNQPTFKPQSNKIIEKQIEVYGYHKTFRKDVNKNIDELRYDIHMDFISNINNENIDDLEINLINLGMEIDADIYHAHEISSVYAAVKIKQLKAVQGKKIKVVYDVHEFFPSIYRDTVAKTDFYKKKYEEMIIEFEKTVLPYCDLVVTVSNSIKEYLESLNKNTYIDLIRNVPTKLGPSYEKIENDMPIICYEGYIRFERGLREIMESCSVLKTIYPEFKLVFIGGAVGDEKSYLDREIEERDLHNNIIQTGWLTPDKAHEEICKCDIGLQLLNNIPNCQVALPNKLFNYMRAGLAVIGMNYKEISSVMKNANCGLLINKLDSNLLTNAMINLIEQSRLLNYFKKNSRIAFESSYNWEKEGEKLLKLYTEFC
ncbi:glycosyltransferase family 4 protein [Bacillus tianshenii]|nr:glycosyltransferase family 4 protein [Bacillus tianshenii]